MARRVPTGDDLSATIIIAKAALDLRRLAKGPIPVKWRRLAGKALAGPSVNSLSLTAPDPLAHLFKKKRLTKKQSKHVSRGRPVEWAPEMRKFVVTRVESIKKDLGKKSGKSISDKRAVREFVKVVLHDWSLAEKAREAELLRKSLPTWRKKVT